MKLRGVKREELDYPAGAEKTFAVALSACISQVESYVNIAFPKEQVLWIHDKGRYEEQAKYRLKDVRRGLNSGQQFEKTLIFRNLPHSPISHIVDTIYFGNSQESRALQLADVCCSTIARHLRGDPLTAPYFELLRSQVIAGLRRPEFENIEETYREMRDKKVKKKHDRSEG
jgi:hypothetical protein